MAPSTGGGVNLNARGACLKSDAPGTVGRKETEMKMIEVHYCPV
jgi:hypothetical protein